jgi:predicted enzyme related to lactoylglutathione lyase
MDRAQKFYAAILDVDFNDMEIGAMSYALFSVDDKFNCGALVSAGGRKPSQDGVTVYLNGGSDLAKVLARVKKAGGRVLVEKTPISKEAGFFGFYADTEGNKVGVHSLS